MAVGRVLWRGTQAALALTGVVVGLTWLNQVAATVMDIGGSCGSGGAYEIATPCPSGTWMAPVGIVGGLICLGAYVFVRPPGSPQLVALAWPAVFGSLGYQFLRAAQDQGAGGFWFCGVLFVLMGGVPVVVALAGDRRAVVRTLVGDGHDREDLDRHRYGPLDE